MLYLAVILSFIIWWAVGFRGYKMTLTQKAIKFKERMSKAKELEEEIIENAKKKALEIEELAHQKADKIEESRQKEIEKRIKQIEELEQRLVKREEKMDEKLDRLEEEKQKIFDKQKEVEDLIDQQKKKLEEIAWLWFEEAKEILFAKVEEEYEKEKKEFIEKIKVITKEEADKEAALIISKALPRIAGDASSEYTTVSVDLPNEEFKWKLIWREWRNIMYFEKVTGCELIIDDTPMLVRVSNFDHEKRFIWVTTLKKLIKDTRINPFYIQKFYEETVQWFDELMLNKWKEALTMLNLPMMKPELVKMIWQFYLRYSYWQNLRQHSIEVAQIAEAIASEMWLDSTLAKKAWLLHDIWKLTAQWWESHAVVWADILRKFDVDPIIVNAAEWHHHDVPMTHPIAWVVAAADAISWSRPWARFNTRELFIEKMTELEKLIKEVTWVEKVHIMQAWREIMVYTNPEEITDNELENLLKTIANKINDQLDYPWIIRVTWIREKKLVEFVK